MIVEFLIKFQLLFNFFINKMVYIYTISTLFRKLFYCKVKFYNKKNYLAYILKLKLIFLL